MRPRRSRARWSARTVSLALSIAWHGLVLAVLALAVHPLPLPRDGPPIVIELEPPLPPPEPLPVLRKLPDEEPLPQPVAPQPVLDKPIEIKRPTPPVLRRLTEVPQPPQPLPPPPEPLAVARPPQPVLAQPTEVRRLPSAPPKLIDTSRPAPAIPSPPTQAEPAKSDVAPPTPAPLQVLTNDRAIEAPVEIKPPARTTIAPRNTVVALPQLPAAGEGSAGAPGAAAAGGGGGTKPFDGHIVGFENDGLRGGLRMRLGCENPETYHLSPEEKAECLRRLAEQAKAAAMMGPNIPEAKQAEYERQRACHAATISGGIPNSTAQSDSTGKILGLGANARLRDCGPGDR
jgi:hypothetical protein